MVSGLRTFVFASGSFTRMPPRAERSGVGTGVGVGAGLGVGLASPSRGGEVGHRGSGVGVVTTMRLSTHAVARKTHAEAARPILTSAHLGARGAHADDAPASARAGGVRRLFHRGDDASGERAGANATTAAPRPRAPRRTPPHPGRPP